MAILIVLLLVTARCALAQPSPPSFTDDNSKNPYAENFNAATAILIVAIVSGFFFLTFFSVYFRRCYRDRSATVLPALAGSVTASRRGVARGGRGLDPAVIETFPTLTYAAAKGLKVGGGKEKEEEALECAVCLSEFAGDDETLRMLPKCCHVFHPECIDTWLESHVTCPVCRADLSALEPTAAEAEAEEEAEARGTCTDGGEVAIDVSRISRSHSLGHVTSGSDRFTLRLQEHVRREIVAAGRLRRSASMAVFRGGGEGSMRRGYRGMSERWTSGILATWRRSSREAAAEESSVRGGGGGGAMFNCLGGGSGGGGEELNDKGESSNVSVLARV